MQAIILLPNVDHFRNQSLVIIKLMIQYLYIFPIKRVVKIDNVIIMMTTFLK